MVFNGDMRFLCATSNMCANEFLPKFMMHCSFLAAFAVRFLRNHICVAEKTMNDKRERERENVWERERECVREKNWKWETVREKETRKEKN